jgi:hypothetical protein
VNSIAVGGVVARRSVANRVSVMTRTKPQARSRSVVESNARRGAAIERGQAVRRNAASYSECIDINALAAVSHWGTAKVSNSIFRCAFLAVFLHQAIGKLLPISLFGIALHL